MELKEFEASRHARNVVECSLTLKKLGITDAQKAQIARDIEKNITWAIEDYLDVISNNVVLKKKLDAPLKLADAKALLAQAHEIMEDLKEWKPEGGIPGFEKMEGYEKGDEEAPFFSEACLYTLFGWKDPARSLLGRMRSLAEAIGALDAVESGF
jgi:hypothetical protein